MLPINGCTIGSVTAYTGRKSKVGEAIMEEYIFLVPAAYIRERFSVYL